MKAVGLTAVALLSGFVLMASAQEDQYAYSANAVGVIRKTLPAGKMMLVSVPLDDATSTNAAIPFLELPFLTTLPNNSTINMWDPETSEWVSGVKSRGKWSGLVTNESLQSGQSLFIKNGGSSAVTLTLVGEVPEDSSIPVALANANQIQGCANPYPVSFVFGTSSLASNAVNNSTVNFWDVENSDWISGSKSRGSWDAKVRTKTVAPAEGFLLKNGATAASGRTWEVSKPYEWPETSN